MAFATRRPPQKWTCMADQLPPEGVTFVLTSSKWKDRQYLVKKVWTATEKRNNKTALHCLYWLPLPPFNEKDNSKTS